MKIHKTTQPHDLIPDLKAGRIHVVGFAELGMAFFRDYLVFAFEFSLDDAISLCRRINNADETGTIWPKGNLTGMPVRFFREPLTECSMSAFRKCLRDCFVANRDYCKSEEIIFRFDCAIQNKDIIDREVCEMALSTSDDAALKRITLIFDAV